MCRGVVPIMFGWFLRVPSLYMCLFSFRKLFCDFSYICVQVTTPFWRKISVVCWHNAEIYRVSIMLDIHILCYSMHSTIQTNKLQKAAVHVSHCSHPVVHCMTPPPPTSLYPPVLSFSLLSPPPFAPSHPSHPLSSSLPIFLHPLLPPFPLSLPFPFSPLSPLHPLSLSPLSCLSLFSLNTTRPMQF